MISEEEEDDHLAEETGFEVGRAVCCLNGFRAVRNLFIFGGVNWAEVNGGAMRGWQRMAVEEEYAVCPLEVHENLKRDGVGDRTRDELNWIPRTTR